MLEIVYLEKKASGMEFCTNSEHVEKGIDGAYRFMWFSVFFAAVATGYLLSVTPLKFLVAWPFIISWFVFPSIAWWISRPMVTGGVKLNRNSCVSSGSCPGKHGPFLKLLSGLRITGCHLTITRNIRFR